MANKKLFKSLIGKMIPATDALNEESAPAYALAPKHALAQYAATGCLNATFYAGAEEQLAKVLELCAEVEPEFIARTAIFCRERGHMKDTPALLCAVLSVRDRELFKTVFPRVIDNGRMLRTFVQIMRSGVVGRKSLGTQPKRLVREWFETRDVESIFAASIGQSPSFADILKMVHPKPTDATREAFYGYLVKGAIEREALPEFIKSFEAFKAGESLDVPPVPFQMLTALPLSTKEWAQVARTASWTMTRMNLNTFARHGVFGVEGMTEIIAARLRDEKLVKRANCFPYALMTAYVSTDEGVPRKVRAALQDAMEIAIANVPKIKGKVYVLPDISGSMHSPVTGHRAGATTAVRCIDVASLVAASILRHNPDAEVIPFESNVVKVNLNPRDSVMTNAEKLAKLPCGGTNCSAPLRHLNKQNAKGDLVFYVSDNESWLDAPSYGQFGGSRTETMREWERFKNRNPQARMVCLDIQPYGTTQAAERHDIMNIGGFNDAVFDVVADFAAGRSTREHWLNAVEAIEL